MHNFLSRESEIGKTLLKYFELKREYHRQAADRIANEEEKFRQLLDNAIAPVYGEELCTHLKRSGTKIAAPIRACVCRLLQLDVCEEGLFRVAAPTLKIRRLASLIDTGNCTDDQVKIQTDNLERNVFWGIWGRSDSFPSNTFKVLDGPKPKILFLNIHIDAQKDIFGVLHKNNFRKIFWFFRLAFITEA